MRTKSLSHVQLCDAMDGSLSDCLCPWDSRGKNTGVGCHALLQGIFPTPGIKPVSHISCIAMQLFVTSAPLGVSLGKLLFLYSPSVK